MGAETFNKVPSDLDGPAFKARMATISADMKPVIEQLGLLAKEVGDANRRSS